jgi:hypothetical protein
MDIVFAISANMSCTLPGRGVRFSFATMGRGRLGRSTTAGGDGHGECLFASRSSLCKRASARRRCLLFRNVDSS